uniref:hypothetical protein n=1 Tax=Escherichia coli TaxID=562 RepID=UPI003890176A
MELHYLGDKPITQLLVGGNVNYSILYGQLSCNPFADFIKMAVHFYRSARDGMGFEADWSEFLHHHQRLQRGDLVHCRYLVVNEWCTVHSEHPARSALAVFRLTEQYGISGSMIHMRGKMADGNLDVYPK